MVSMFPFPLSGGVDARDFFENKGYILYYIIYIYIYIYACSIYNCMPSNSLEKSYLT